MGNAVSTNKVRLRGKTIFFNYDKKRQICNEKVENQGRMIIFYRNLSN
jgi:hypothetical protein